MGFRGLLSGGYVVRIPGRHHPSMPSPQLGARPAQENVSDWSETFTWPVRLYLTVSLGDLSRLKLMLLQIECRENAVSISHRQLNV